MALSLEDQRDLQAILVLFFPQDRGLIEGNAPNEHTLDLTESFLVEVDKCTKVMQKFLADIGAGLTRGFLRRTLRQLGRDAARPDGFLRGNIACTNVGAANFRKTILLTFAY